MRFTAVLAVLLVCVGFCSAATYNLSPSNTTWADTLRGLTAGDIAILAPYVIHPAQFACCDSFISYCIVAHMELRPIIACAQW
jgi:hypothetical protein